MNIHEYQAKQLFAKAGLAVPQGHVCETVDEALAAYAALSTDVCVVKAQIHAGGRGKGGGVKLVKNADECREAAEAILGMTLVTHQTGPEGQLVRKVWVEEGSDIASPLLETGIFPPMVVQMIGVGEQSGAMDEMLQKIADFYEEEVDVAVGSMTALLGPLMVVGLGGAVGTMLIAMYLPIFEVAGNIK